MSGMPTAPAARHRVISSRFGELVRGTRDWQAPTPVAGWLARDILGHLIDWLPGLLASGSAVHLEDGPAVEQDPVGAWTARARAVQALLEDPVVATRPFADPHIGELTLAQALDRFWTPDVFLHSWDLARATGQEPTLDPDLCRELLAGMQPVEELMRSSGQYGPPVPVDEDASPQDQLLGFIGRDPHWHV